MLSQRGAAVRAIVCDVRDMRQVESAVREVVEWRGRVDILINNAAIFPPGLLMQMDEDVWTSVIDTNLNGAFRMVRACVPGMIRNRWGRVINIESPSGLMGMVTVPAYGTSKGALMAFTRMLAAEVGRFGVTVNGLCPAWWRPRSSSRHSPRRFRPLQVRRCRSAGQIVSTISPAHCCSWRRRRVPA